MIIRLILPCGSGPWVRVWTNKRSAVLKFIKSHPRAVLGTLTVLLVAALGIPRACSKKKPPELPQAPRITAKVEKGDIVEKVEEIARLQPRTFVRVKANATGMVSRLLMEEGDTVKAGQLLAVIQPGRPGEAFKPSSVYAPMSGVVIERNVELGDVVTSSLSEYGRGTQICSVARLDNMLAVFSVNEVDILKIKPGMPTWLKTDALPKLSFTGKVYTVSPMAKPPEGGGAYSFGAKVLIDGSHVELRPGMSAVVEIVIAEKRGVMSLPVEAVFDEEGKNFAYKIEGGETRRIELKTGLSDNRRVEILGPLKLGDTVSTVRPSSAIPPRI